MLEKVKVSSCHKVCAEYTIKSILQSDQLIWLADGYPITGVSEANLFFSKQTKVTRFVFLTMDAVLPKKQMTNAPSFF